MGSSSASDTAESGGSVPPMPLDLAAVFREHYEFVWRSLRRMGLPEADADDAAQQVFLVAARRLPELERHTPLRGWLYTVAVHVAQRHRRTTRRRLAWLSTWGREPRPTTTLDGIARFDAASTAGSILSRLRPDRQEVLLLTEFEGLNGPELAQALQVPLRTAYSRLRAAHEALDRELRRTAATEDRASAAKRALAAERERQPARPGAAQRALALFVGRWPEVALTRQAPVSDAGLLAWLGSHATTLSAATVGVSSLVVATALWVPREAPPPTSSSDAARPRPPISGAHALPTRGPPAVPTEVPAAPDRAAFAAEPAESVITPRIGRPDRPAATAPATDALDAEREVVSRAHAALAAGEPLRALAELDRADASLGTGMLQDERRKLRIRALCATGRVAQARGEATAWRREAPASPHAAASAAACSEPPTAEPRPPR